MVNNGPYTVYGLHTVFTKKVLFKNPDSRRQFAEASEAYGRAMAASEGSTGPRTRSLGRAALLSKPLSCVRAIRSHAPDPSSASLDVLRGCSFTL